MYKAILVDDEKIVRLALKTIVDWTALGYTVTGSYSSVKTALLEIEDDPPNLIITDIKMPDMDGLQFIQQVRQQNRECEIIVRGGGNSPGGDGLCGENRYLTGIPVYTAAKSRRTIGWKKRRRAGAGHPYDGR